jgi:membrane protein required for beta-lactamase induction
VTDWLTWWFILGGAVAVVLIAFLIALIRQVFLLGRTARRMQEELSPVVHDISSQAARASARSSSMKPPGRTERGS